MTPARLNPFRTEQVATLPFRFADDWSWSRLLEELAGCGNRAALVGPHGSGKTTLLEQLGRRLLDRGDKICLLRLNEDSYGRERARLMATVERLPAGTWLLLDGAEQLGWLAWRRLIGRTKTLRGLVVTQHACRRLPMLYRTATSARLLGELGSSLLADQVPARPAPDWPQLHQRFQGNLRDVFRACYSGFAR